MMSKAALVALGLYVCGALFGVNVLPVKQPIGLSVVSKPNASLPSAEQTVQRIVLGNVPDTATQDDIDKVLAILRMRLDTLGYTEADITFLAETKEVEIRLPMSYMSEELNLALYTQTLTKAPELTFQDADGNTVLSGSDIQSAEAMLGQTRESGPDEHYIEVRFSDRGAEKFSAATKAAAERDDGKNYLVIMLGEEVISMPAVYQEINSSVCMISGGFATGEDAKALASLINAGKLPFTLTVKKTETVTAN